MITQWSNTFKTYMASHMLDHILEIGKGVTEGIGDVFADAAASVQDPAERAYIRSLLDRARQGELGVYTLSARCRTIGAICYRAMDGDAELAFGHMASGDAEAYFLEGVVKALFADGVHTVRSNFNWPEPAGFIKAAVAMGFIMTERMGMCLAPRPAQPECRDFELSPWQDAYAGDICVIMCEDQSPADRPVYPIFGKLDGVRKLMDSVMHDRHGTFLKELTCVAMADGRLIGFLLCTMLNDGSVLILDIGVHHDHRKKGVASAMLDRLINGAYDRGYGQIVLAVTSKNYDAIRLYERKGFKVNGYFRQHVLSIVR
jgi:ribosomal protein S18 acetylase RimI-like enzyme